MNEKRRILSTVSIYHAIDDGSVAVIPLLFPILKSQFHLNYTQIGIITGGGLLLTLIAQLLIGRIADGRNSATLLSTGILFISASLLILTQSTEFFSLLLFILLFRLSTSFFHPIGVGWISRTFKRENLDSAMGIQSGFADVGAFIATATTLYLVELRSWNFPLRVWSVFGILGLFAGIALTQKIRNDYLVAPTIKIKQHFKEAIHETYGLLRRIKFLVPAFMISGASWGVIITYLPLLLSERTNLPLPLIGLLVAIWIGVGSITSFFYGKIKKLIGRRAVLFFSYLTLGIMGLLLSYFTNIIILFIIMVFMGISVFVTYPALFSFVSEVTHESVEGRTFGVIFTLQLGGGTLLTFLSGVLSDIFGIWIPFALLGTLSLFLTTVLISKYKKPLASL